MKKEHIPRVKTHSRTNQEREDIPWGGHGNPKQSPRDLEKDLDEVLAEIDELLEENAEEFVKSYVQKGGE